MSSANRKQRARRYDPARTRTALAGEVRAIQDAVGVLCAAPDASQLLRSPTRLGDWTVGELIAHLAVCLDSLPGRLAEQPAPARADLDLQGYLRGLEGQGDDIARAAADAAASLPGGRDAPEALREHLDEAADRLTAAVAEAAGDTPVPTRCGALTVDDFLVTRLLEMVVHGDDLTAMTGTAIAHDRQALAVVTRLLADALAWKAPGGSVEVRVPPFAVVQCVPGPKHTRGTPPNVVEAAPQTWIRLATGRRTWQESLAVGEVTASGERADLSEYLPVVR